MDLPVKYRKSAGVAVTPRVHRIIQRGNRARGGDWRGAAEAYRAALAHDPTLFHIWVQFGHALAEAGDYESSIEAYVAASRLQPDDGEPWLHMAHSAKRADQRARAARYYLAAAARGGVENEAADEAERIVSAVARADRGLMREAGLRVREDGSIAPARATASREASATVARVLDRIEGRAEDAKLLDQASTILKRLEGEAAERGRTAALRPVVFDITDLVAHFRNHRLPTGIQRVQIEVIVRALRASEGAPVSVCCFVDGRDYWIGIDADTFLHIAHLASAGSSVADPEWQAAAGALFLGLAVDDHFTLPADAILVNLGTSWWIYDYFRLIRDAKETIGLSYVPFVHDFIPVMAPEHVVRGVTEDYVSWAVGVFQHADFFLVNSESTKRDLLHVAARLGHAVDEANVEVVPLDADFRREGGALPVAHLGRWELEGVPYALFVSTIESRKNHALAFETWARLIREHGAEKVPQLVCVGRNGWLYDHAFERLDAYPELGPKVTIISQVSDDELALLYRECRFTVYPSHYEGWGLPITESLCYGRVPVIADNSSLPEAGAGFAEIFANNSIEDFARAVAAVAFDDAAREATECRIAADYAPRSWGMIARQINGAIFTLGAGDKPARTVSRAVEPGLYYPIRLYREPELWTGLASGEIFRAGDGWLWPDTLGCLTRPGGGALRFALSAPLAQGRVYLRLSGLAGQATRFTVRIGDAEIAAGHLDAGETRWAAADLPANTGPDVTLHVAGADWARTPVNTGGTIKHPKASIRVHGFVLCDGADAEERARIVAAIAYGDPETISAYRRPQ